MLHNLITPTDKGLKKIEPMEICHISSCERLINEPMVQQALDVQEHKEWGTDGIFSFQA